MTAAHRLLRNRAGFTIFELVIVTVIIAVMTGLALPAFREAVQEDDLSAATRQVQTLFRIARDSAIKSGVPVTVWIDSASTRVWLVSASAEGAGGVAVQQESDPGIEIGFPTTIRLLLSKPRARFRFSSSGAVFADSLTLRDPYGSRVITLHPWTGDVVY